MGDDTRDRGNDFLRKLATAKEVRLETETDRLEEIKAHDYSTGITTGEAIRVALWDRPWLITEVERLRQENGMLREALVVVRDVGDGDKWVQGYAADILRAAP